HRTRRRRPRPRDPRSAMVRDRECGAAGAGDGDAERDLRRLRHTSRDIAEPPGRHQRRCLRARDGVVASRLLPSIVTRYAVIVLVALLIDHALRIVASVLDLRTFQPTPPREFRDVFDADRYRRAQSYVRARTRFGMLASTTQLAAVLLFWFAGG